MSKGVKITVICVALLTAVVVFAFNRSGSEKPELAQDTQMLDVICTKCGEHFQITYEEHQKLIQLHPAASDDGQPTSLVRQAKPVKPLMIHCPKCSEETGVLANKCAEHEKFYPKVNLDGTRGKCPDCG